MKKRLLSLVLAFVMVLGMLPATAFAAEGETVLAESDAASSSDTTIGGFIEDESGGEVVEGESGDDAAATVGQNGFDLILSVEDNLLYYQLKLPDTETAADAYYVDLVGSTTKCLFGSSVSQNRNYKKNMWALTEAGTYDTVKVIAMDSNGNEGDLLAQWTLSTPIVVTTGDANMALPADLALTVVAAESGVNGVTYQLTGTTSTAVVYSVADVNGEGQGSVYTLETGNKFMTEQLDNNPVKLYAMQAGTTTAAYTLNISAPVDLTVPAYTATLTRADVCVAIVDAMGWEYTADMTAKFTDVADHKDYEAIAVMCAYGIFDDSSEGNFMPDSAVTRAELAKILCVVLGSDGDDTAATRPVDVLDGHWAAGYVCTVLNKGLMSVDEAGYFNPYTAAVVGDADFEMLALLADSGEEGGEVVEPEAPEVAVVASGTCGEVTETSDGSNLTWTLNSLGTLIITGEGAMADYDGTESAPWVKYMDQITSVVIQTGVTYVGNYAFDGCGAVSAVYFYGNAPGIAEFAFHNMTATVFYPANNTTWTAAVMQNYGAVKLAWVSVNEDGTTGGTDEDTSGSFGEGLHWTLDTNTGMLTISGSGAMPDKTVPWIDYVDQIVDVNIEEGVTSIGALTFFAHEKLKNVAMSYTVTSIGAKAFYGCAALEDVAMGTGVTAIGDYAFCGCTALGSNQTILSLDGAQTIGNYAFSGCSALTSVSLMTGLATIGECAFQNCTGLTALSIPGSVTGIGKMAFSGCTNLMNVNFTAAPVTVLPGESTGSGDVAGTDTVVSTTGGVAVGESAFSGCTKLEQVMFNGSVTAIGANAFYGCTALTEIRFMGDAPTGIDAAAFTGVTALCYYPVDPESGWTTWPDSVMQNYGGSLLWVSENAMTGFCGADADSDKLPDGNLIWALTRKYEYDENKEPYYYLVLDIAGSGVMMDYDLFSGVMPPWCGKDAIRTVNLPEGLTSIGNFAFFNCYGLSELVEIPSTVKSVGMGAFYGAYQSSEEENPALLTVTIPASVESIGAMAFASPLVEAYAVEEGNQHYCAVEGVLFEAHLEEVIPDEMSPSTLVMVPDVLIQYPAAKTDTAYTLPSCVTGIGVGAFTEVSEQLFRVTVPASVKSVGSGAFSNCDTKWIHFVGAAPEFASDAFSNSTLLCTYPAGDESWAAVETETYDASSVIWKGVDENGVVDSGFCGAVTEEYPKGGNLAWTFYVDGTLEVTGSGAMCDHPGWSVYNPYMLKAVLPDGLTTIGASAFEGCKRVETVTIPDGVISIGNNAFYGCSALTEVLVPAAVKTMGEYAFAYCDALTEITIPGSVAAIGDYAFYECDALTCVTIGDGVLTVGVCAFQSCSALAAVEFGSEVQIIGASAFYDCDSLTVITLPDKVTTVGNSAFADCGNLTLISFGGGLKTLGDYAFSADLKLKSIKFTGMYPSCGSRTFGNVTATVYYPNNGLWGAASQMPTTWGGAAALTWVATTDYTAPVLSNVFAKTATDANLLWQIENTDFTGDALLYMLQNSDPNAGYATLSDAVTLYWTGPEDATVYNWCGGQTLGTTEVHQGFNVWDVNVPVAYADGPAYMLALVDETGNIAWELVELETNDVTAPEIAVDEKKEPILTAIRNEEGKAVLTWTNASADVSAVAVFLDKDGDGKWDLDSKEEVQLTIGSSEVLEDGSWSVTLEETLSVGTVLTVMLTDGACNMVSYPVTLTSSDDGEKPGVELKAEPATAGGDEIKVEIALNATDNVGVREVVLTYTRADAVETLKTWTISASGETKWSDTYSWDVSDLASGEYTLTVTVEDKAGNKTSETVKITVDNTAPSAGALTYTVEGKTVTLNWGEQSDDLNTVTVRRAYRDPVISGGWSQYEDLTGTVGTTFVDDEAKLDGEYIYYVRLTDKLGNVNTTGNVCVMVDTTAPELNVYEAPKDGSRVWNTVTFGVSSEDVLSKVASTTVEWFCGEQSGSETLTDSTCTINISGMAEGETLTVTFTAVDNVGNQSEPVTLAYTIDNKPEAPTNLTAKVEGEGILLSWKASKSEDNVEKYVLLRAEVDAEGAAGTYEAVDTNIGKVTLGSVIGAIVADAVKAELQAILTGQSGVTVGDLLDNYSLSDAAKAALEAIQCDYLDTNVEFGVTYSYKLVAQGYSGLAESQPTQAVIFEDKAAPVVNTFELDTPEAVYGGTKDVITFQIKVTDNAEVDHLELSWTINGEKTTKTLTTPECSYGLDVSGFPSGEHVISLVAVDTFGNPSDAKTVTVTVDNTAPDAPADVKAEGSCDYIRLTWAANAALEEGGSYRIERDGVQVGTCAGNKLYFDDIVSDYGEHTYQVFAVDAVGNEAAGETVTAKKVADTEKPVVFDVWPRGGMTICHSTEVQISATDNWKVVKVEAGYALNGGEIVWFDPVVTDSVNPVVSFPWNVVALSGEATLYFKVTDAAGYTAERSETVNIMTYAAPKAPANLTCEAGFKSVTLNWNEGDTTLLKQFKVCRVTDGGEELLANLQNNTYTVNGLTEETTLRVYAEDIYGTISEKAEITVTPVLTESVAPVAVIQPRKLTGVVGAPVHFYGGNSTDNDAVKTYEWTFHDGKTVEAVTTEKTYSAAGTYEVTLTVTDNSGNSASATGTVTIYDVTGDSATHTVLTVTVNDSTTPGTPLLENVTVTVTNDDGFETSALTDNKGKAVLVVPQGECTLTAIKNGYAGAVRKIEVTSDEQGCAYQAVSLAAGGVSTLSGSLTAERMTYEEIKAAGIDITNPANNHVVKQEFALRFVATPELAFDIPVTNYVNASGHCVGGVGLGWGTYVREDDHYTPVIGTPSVGEIVEDSVTVGIFPVGKSYYLVIYGETHWLKEMFHVELILVNNSYEEDVRDCIATLNLPEGLSLAAMLDYGQSARVSVGDIDRAAVDPETGTTAFDQAQVSWYVRGDVMGEYYLTADVTGNFVNDDNQKTPINMTFETTESIKVYAGDALHLTITAQDTAYSEKEYRVQFKLENVSDIDLYNLSFGLTGAEQYSCIVWSDGTETRFEDLDKEDFGDKMTFRVPVLEPGQFITINYVTTCLFEADLASALVDKVTFGTMEIAFKLTNVFVTTLEGSTTEIPTDVILEPVPKATFTEWLWGEIKDAAKDGVKDAILQAFDALFFGGVPVTQYGVKVFEVGSDLLEDTKANSKAVVTISDGAYFLDSDNVIHTSGGAVVDPAALYSLRRNAGGVAVYTDAEDYTLSDDGKTMTINGEGNVYLLRTGDTGDVEPEVQVTTEYLLTNPNYDPDTDPESEKYLEKTFTRTLKESVKVDDDGNVITDDEGNPVLQDYSADLITATDVTLLAPAADTLEVPAEGTVSVTFPHFMTDGEGTVATAAQNISWVLTDAAGEAVTAGMDLTDGVLSVNSLAQPGVYAVTLSINGTETSVSQSITLSRTSVLPGNEPAGKTGLVYTGAAHELISAGTSASGTMQYALGTDSTTLPEESAWSVLVPKAVNAGTYHVWYRVLADGDSGGVGAAYVGGVTIASKDVSGAVITLGDAPTYTGQEQSQTVASVVVDGKTLAAGTDYTVTGNTAVDVGGEDYTLTVTGTGNYTGTAAKDWNLAKAGQTAPDVPGRSTVTQDSITLTDAAGGQGDVEYKCGDGLWQASPEFTGLTAATRYTFAVRYTGDGNYNEAISASVDFYTAAAAPGAGEGYAVDYVGETVAVTDGYEVYTAVVDGAPVNSGSLVTPGTTLYIRVAANGEIPASAWTELTIPARPAAPSGLQGIHETIDGRNDGRITGITAAMEYSTDSIHWTGGTAEAVTDLADGTYPVRVKAVAGVSFAGVHADVVISAGRKIGVFFEENGGTAVADQTGLTYNIPVTLPEITRVGYTFDGWAAEADGDVVHAPQASVNVTDDMTLYAKWTAITYTVKFDANGGSGTMADQTLTYDAAQKLTGNAFTRSGYTFAGWNTAANGSGTGYANGRNVVNLADTQDAVVTLYARWNAIYYPPAGGTSGGTISTTTTTKNEDGSVTTTKIDRITGTVTETTKNTDGSTTVAQTQKDGTVTTTTTGTTTETTEDGATVTTDSTVTETVAKDGTSTTTATTQTKTETADGATETVKVEQTVVKSGNTTSATTTTTTETAEKTETVEVKSETVVAADGTETTTSTTQTRTETADGTTGTATKAADGTVTAEVTVSAEAAERAAETGTAVVLPIPAVEVSASAENAPTVTVTADGGGSVTVEVPVENLTSGTVVVMLNTDGTETVVTKTGLTETGVTVTLEGNAAVKVVDNAKTFADVAQDDWYSDAVGFTSARELYNGVGNNLFAPNGDMTRGMLATVLHNLEDNPEHAHDDLFHDVQNHHWYEQSVYWAAQQGYVEGYPDGSFRGENAITRQDMVVLFWRYAGSPGSDHSLSHFADAGTVSDYARTAVRWANECGILNGMDGLLNPHGTTTRAQVAQLIMNYLELGI